MGLGAALGIASNALNVFMTGIQIAGQNIANANTPGYIKENLQVTPGLDYGVAPLILGTGVIAQGVTQQVNQFLQTQILTANSNYNAANAIQTAYTNLQQQLQALGTGNNNNLATQVNAFVSSLNNLANQPESLPLREQAINQGTQLASYITTLRQGIDQQIRNENVNVQQLVTQANQLIQQIAQLNPQITQSESSGLGSSQAGALRDQRYQALNQLSQIIPVTYTENSDGSVSVYTGSNYLILGSTYQQLQTVTSSTGDVGTLNVQLSLTGSQITAASTGTGELVGVLQGRDNVLGGFAQNLDSLTSSLISQFNQIYSSGQGLQGFTSVTSNNSVSDATAALNQAGLQFAPQNGNFQINVTNTITGQTTTTTIGVNLNGTGSDVSLNGLASELNGVSNISASVTADGHLQIDANPNYQISFANDTSHALASLGINTFFTGSNSEDIGVDSSVTNNPSLFAAGQGGGPSDGSNALSLSQFASTPDSTLNGLGISDYYNALVTNIGNKASAETAMATSMNDYLQSLNSQQQQYSGVSLDEEAIALMQYQQSYQAAARVVSTVDKMFQTLINV